MSSLAPGNYTIVNSITPSSGHQFACNFNGNNSAVNVATFQWKALNQVWTVAENPEWGPTAYELAPLSSNTLRIAMGDNEIKTIDDDAQYIWYINVNNYVYTISDGSLTSFWDLNPGNMTDGAKVILAPQTGLGTQNWEFVPVPN